MNVRELRPNQPFLVGSQVRIGTSETIFTVRGLGLCSPHDYEPMRGQLINGSEFVQLHVPGQRRLFQYPQKLS